VGITCHTVEGDREVGRNRLPDWYENDGAGEREADRKRADFQAEFATRTRRNLTHVARQIYGSGRKGDRVFKTPWRTRSAWTIGSYSSAGELYGTPVTTTMSIVLVPGYREFVTRAATRQVLMGNPTRIAALDYGVLRHLDWVNAVSGAS